MTYDAPALIRFVCFSAVLLGLAFLEAWWPRRQRDRDRASRWPHNLALVALDTVLLRAVQPAGAVGVAIWAEVRGIGLWNNVDAPVWLPFLSTLLVLDLAVYAQHVLFHRVPALWRLHRVHHADVDVDVTTGLRFHPIEMLVSLGLKGGVVALWGGGAWAVLMFEVLLNATSMFTHANLALPARLDGLLRRVVVTPDMHRVHHSVQVDECNSNFGFNLSCWDHWFGTYRRAPRGGHETMVLGLHTHRTRAEQRLDRLLTQPFRASGPAVAPDPTRGDASPLAHRAEQRPGAP